MRSSMVSVVMASRGVVGVDAHVVGGEIAAPGVTLGSTAAEVDADVEAVLGEDSTHRRRVRIGGRAVAEDDDVADGDTTAVQSEVCAAAAQRGDDASPVGITTVDGGLHQRAA